MPLLQTSGNVTADGYGGGVAVVPNYIEDVFSTYLYTGNGSTQTITNGIDLSTYGGLVWLKYRSGAASTTYHHVYDSARGKSGNTSYNYLYTNTTSPQGTGAFGPTSFNTDGFSLNSYLNESTITYVGWTFRKQPKFFDVVTYTGTGVARTIAHSLGSVPGCIIIKRTDAGGTLWYVYHRANTSGGSAQSQELRLNNTNATNTNTDVWNNTAPTSTVFSIGAGASPYDWNASGGSYVAYLFAHDAGGFGLSGSDNVISCGSFTTDSAGFANVNLGYEPQWVLTKNATNAENWVVCDVMRSMTTGPTTSASSATGTQTYWLKPNSSDAEETTLPTYATKTQSTGFSYFGGGGSSASSTYIYIAIRRGPMKVPTSGTSVFSTNLGSGANPQTLTTNFPVDLSINTLKSGQAKDWVDRLRGTGASVALIKSDSSVAEITSSGLYFDNNTAIVDSGWWNSASSVYWNMRRAPSFFDEVCWTGTGSGSQAITHNLGVVPEFTITKRRSGTGNWSCFPVMFGVNTGIYLDSTAALQTNAALHPTLPTATTYYTNDASWGDENIGGTFVTYLFATCAGVSKVGSYTGNGSTQTINCGFTGGARFVLIKRTDSTGDWYVYDTARGMTVLTDPYLLLNSTAAESATLGSVTTVSTGFAVNASILAAINTNGASYIFLAIA